MQIGSEGAMPARTAGFLRNVMSTKSVMYITSILMGILTVVLIYNPSIAMYLYNPMQADPYEENKVHVIHDTPILGNASKLQALSALHNLRHDQFFYASGGMKNFAVNGSQILSSYNRSGDISLHVQNRLNADAYEAGSVLKEFNRSPAIFDSVPLVGSLLLEPSESSLTSVDGWDTPTDHEKLGPYEYTNTETTHAASDGHIYLNDVKLDASASEAEPISDLVSVDGNEPELPDVDVPDNVYYRPQKEKFTHTRDDNHIHVHFGHSFTQRNITAAKNVTQTLLSLIRHRYELDGPIGSQYFLTANNMENRTWDMMKYKFAKYMIGNIFLERDDPFVMVFGGSNVTAGYRNYYHQSYPMIVKDRLGPLLKAMGIELVVHNIAQKNNDCSPFVLCYEAMGRADPDWIGWEQSTECDEPSNDATYEMAARFAGWSINKAVVYYSAPSYWSTDSCPSSKEKIPYNSEEWTEQSAGIEKWFATQGDLHLQRELLHKYFTAKPSVNSFLQWGKNTTYLSSVGPHGFNDMERNYRCTRLNGTTGCNGRDVIGNCQLKFMTREAALYGSGSKKLNDKGMSRAFHMLRGEAISWLYGLIFLDAILMVENALKVKDKSPATLYLEYNSILESLMPGADLFEPSRCNSYHCDSKMTCYTNYLPHYSSDQTLDEVLVGHTNWTYFSGKISQESKTYGYMDRKPAYHSWGMSDAGEIRIKLELGSSLFMWVCGDKLQDDALFYLDANVLLYNDVNYQPFENRIVWKKLTTKGPTCVELHGLPKGEHVLSIAAKADSPHARLSLTHVIFWP